MRKYILCLVAVFVALSVCGAKRTPEQAVAVAVQNLSAHHKIAPRQLSSAAVVEQTDAYFAVNTSAGFVLVSADDNMPDILGYSTASTFCTDSLPPAFRFWLQNYNAEVSTIDTVPSGMNRVRTFADSRSPILSCRWNQASPFNDSVPAYDASHRAAAGCVATAMAQIMYAYRFPDSGTGSHSYLWTSRRDPSLSATLSADFAHTVYDWASMLDTYTSASPVASCAAVATLLYHCGIAVDMGYDCNSSHESGAVTSKVPNALATYFGYDSHYQALRKDIYPADSLSELVADELRAGRPVLVAGSNASGGHAFVCDGYNADGYFHINWGWGGTSDGYFLLSALNPGAQGIGGTTHGYNQSTVFYVGLQPANGHSAPYPAQMAADSIAIGVASLPRTQSFSLSAYRIQNYGLDNYSGKVGVALYDEDETHLITVLQSTPLSLQSNYYRTTPLTLSDMQIPASVPDGTYHLCFVYQDPEYGWLRMMNKCDDYYKTLFLTATQIECTDNHAPAELSLVKPIAFPDSAAVPTSGAPLSFAVKNTGGTFRGNISARIYQGNFAKGQYEIIDTLAIRRGEIFSSALQQAFDTKLKVGVNYKMKLCWRADSSDSWHEFTPAEYAVLQFRLVEPPEDIPSALDDALSSGAQVIDRQWLMSLPEGDLYVFTIQYKQHLKRYKIILHK